MTKHTAFPAFIYLPFWAMFLPDKVKPAAVKHKNDNENEESLPIRLRGLY